jgi:hypothetical protein
VNILKECKAESDVFSEFRAMLAELVRNDLKTLSPVDRVPDLSNNAVVHFVVGAVMSVLTWWMDS